MKLLHAANAPASRSGRLTVVAVLAIACLIAPSALLKAEDAGANSLIAPVSERFGSVDAKDVPDFQRHVVPLMGRVGCNGRSCHGSFQGQGGFRLSLFGYDFKMDHAGLKERLDLKQPLNSLALQKPSMVVEHEGGQKLVPGSWQHTLFLKWIESGAAPRSDDAADLVRLEIIPADIRFAKAGETVQLKAIAHWDDGTAEDVTCLTRFQSNDPAVATVSESGLVTGADAGDSHVVAFYDNGIVSVPVLRPYSDLTGDKYPKLAASTPIDQHVLDKLSRLGVLPSDRCSDEEYLRRVSLDLAGTLPAPDEIRMFVSDTSTDKRAKKVEELLATPAYAARWTTLLCDLTGNNDQQLNNVTPNRRTSTQEWYDWIFNRVSDNVPYDQLMEGIVLAVSRKPGETYYEYCDRTSKMYGDSPTASYADQSGLTYYWGRRNFTTPEERAIGFAYTFMGIRIQCAQCHKHPFDEWTQDDFKDFQAFFNRVRFSRYSPVPTVGSRVADQLELKKILDDVGVDPKKGGAERRKLEDLARSGALVPASELGILPGEGAGRRGRRPGQQNAGKSTRVARLLRSQETINVNELDDPRRPLMEWLRQPENSLFARSFVNRVWAQYFHRGIVHPTDDLSLANPPSNEPLLDSLTEGFIASGYDMKWLHRTIVASDTYQRSWQPNETNRLEERNFSRAVPRRLPAEVAVDAVSTATAGKAANAAMKQELAGRVLTLPGTGQPGNNRQYAPTVFGRSLRENNCDCETSVEPSLLQTLYLRNDFDTLNAIDRRGGWLAEQASLLDLPFQPASGNAERGSEGRNRQRELARRRLAELKSEVDKARESGTPEEVRRAQRQLTAARIRFEAAMEQQNAAGKPDQSVRPAGKPVDSGPAIEDAYLRTLSRLPTDEERAIAIAAVQEASDPVSGLRDVMWALLNTKEFIVNH